MRSLLIRRSEVDALTDGSRRRLMLGVAMASAVALVAALSAWDEARESAAALDEFGQEQATLAGSIAVGMASRLGSASTDTRAILEFTSRFDRPRDCVVLVRPSGSPAWLDATGRESHVDAVDRALDLGLGSTRLSREESASLGLPQRMSLAGISRFALGTGTHGSLAVVATAERLRDRDRRARLRLLLGIAFAAALVLVFGGVALREQRRELALAQELAVSEVARDRDERLGKLGNAATLVALASGVAHEVSTPLGVIVGRAEQVRDRLPADERNRHALESILEQAERIDQVVRGFLRLVRGGPPALRQVPASQVLTGAVALVEHRFREARIGLEVTQPIASDALSCDLTLLQQALVNLLLNACDASPVEGRVIAAATTERGHVVFTVRDRGHGITDADADRALAPFFTTKPLGKGTGMGLAIASEIAKSHHGSVALAPDPQGGTLARLTVPLSQGAPDVRS
ncbi:MAG: HAMP domain-containing histidine kinase [Deltaproteobacteria bacterium]|nr:HAMP domain-containing histidine kinase [Deltaproteobacteria bacterium]